MNTKLICFDLDGTMTAQSTWEVFNTRLGISPEDDLRLFQQYKEGNLEYRDWITELVRLYKAGKPVTRQEIAIAADSIEPRPGAVDAVESAKAKGYEVIAIAGAIDVMAQPLAAKLGIGQLYTANKAVFNEQDELVDIQETGHERDAKLGLLREYCDHNGYELAQVVCVGDGGNDLELFRHAKGILLGTNKELAPVAWKQIETVSELESIL